MVQLPLGGGLCSHKMTLPLQHSSSALVNDLYEDIKDGVLLCHLIEVLTGEALVCSFAFFQFGASPPVRQTHSQPKNPVEFTALRCKKTGRGRVVEK